MPTTRPRYTVTDTGHVERLLDSAQRRWPEITDRKELLLRLAQEGHDALERLDEGHDAAERRERTRAALERIPSLMDAEVLLSDQAWR